MATILITDDDPTLRAIAAELLAAEGHRILEALDGDEELRRRKTPVRILAISSGGSMDLDSLLRTAMVFGADRLMSKPLRLSTFASTVAEMLAAPLALSTPTT